MTGQEHAARSQTWRDRIDPARAAALHAALGLPGPAPKEGTVLPPFFHHIYFWDVQPPHALGADGHPRTGGLIPDLGLPRRMWAGGRLRFHAPLRAGVLAERTSELVNVTRKVGRSGKLGLVTLRHTIRQSGAPVVTEDQDLIYRESSGRPAETPLAPDGGTVEERLAFTPTLLFRYSALTMNGHRIHYDADYARDTEGYPGLVVHGPLLAQVCLLIAASGPRPLRSFAFRATAPLFSGEEAEFLSAQGRLWVRGPDGRLCMEAEAD